MSFRNLRGKLPGPFRLGDHPNNRQRRKRLHLEALEERALLSASGDDTTSTPDPTSAQSPLFFLPSPVHLVASSGYLTPPSNSNPRDVALAYLNTHANTLGLNATDIATALTTSQYTTDLTGMTHIYMRQTHQGLEVLNGVLNINVNALGQVMNVGASFVRGLNTPANNTPIAPALTASQAVAAAASALNLTTAPTSTVTSPAT